MDLGLGGKVAVVTGGSVGIGLAVAEGLAAEGVHVVLAARGGERARAEAARIAGGCGVRALGVACDVATVEGVAALKSRLLDRGGRLRRLAGKGGSGGAAHAEALIVEGRGPKNGRRRVFNLTARRTGRLCEGFAAARKAKVDFGNPRLASYRL